MKADSDQTHTVVGTVLMVWPGDHEDDPLLVNLDPEQAGGPTTFEIDPRSHGSAIEEGHRIRVTYTLDEHEYVDPDSGGPTERHLPRILAVDQL